MPAAPTIAFDIRGFALLLAMACAACSTPVAKPTESGPATRHMTQRTDERGRLELARGIKSYEEAEYEMAARQFRSALDSGLRGPKDQASAYKYLAFLACSEGREKTCYADFRKAFEADPNFKLAPAEAGHPLWGPVFRSVKEEVAAKGRRK